MGAGAGYAPATVSSPTAASRSGTPDAALAAQARAVLARNDRGGYTVPSPGLYPFQWNWDSAVVALGWMTFDEPRAWRELDRLFEGQWENGLLPHIVFHVPADSYFPGPAEWGAAGRNPPTSSISQPPLAATIVRMMSERARDAAGAHAAVARLLPRLLAWHRWWYRDRDPEHTGLAVTFHPWESGLDNSPAWDAPLAAVPPATRPYARKDTGFVNPLRRPRQADYDRYVYLMDFFRQASFDPVRIYAECPYRVADFGLNAILRRATGDLAELCRRHGQEEAAVEMGNAAERTGRALDGLWSDALGAYASLDTRTNGRLEARTHSTFLGWYGRMATAPAVDSRLRAELGQWLGRSPFSLPSTHPDAPQFEAERYWRGPVWPHMNWLVALGLSEAGHAGEALRLAQSTRALIASGGLCEYFSPLSGEGCGGADFSWTAAVVLFWLSSLPDF